MQAASSLRRIGQSLSLLACVALAACSNGSVDEPLKGAAGTSGAAGSGAAGTGSGQAGTNGSAGASSGAAGAQGAAGATTSGVAGASGAAGSGDAGAGSAGTGAAGATGATGATGAGGSSATHVMASAGCGQDLPTGSMLGKYVKYSETITASALVTAKWQPRNYYVWLPTNYDQTHAYPVVFVGPGCGGTGDMGIDIMKASGNDAIVIGLDPDPTAENRQCFNSETYPDPEVPYFDQTLTTIESTYCVDKSRLFIEGFSSGSWMANLIGCVDAGTIRAQGNASGCLQGIPAGTCTKPIAYFEAHNNPDPNNSFQCGMQNRDEKVKRNGCSATKPAIPFDPGAGITTPSGATISCVQYQDCMQPTIFCTTTGLNPQHNPQDDSSTNLLTTGVWRFWMSLP